MGERWVGFQQFSSWLMDDVCVYKSVEIYAIEEKYIYICFLMSSAFWTCENPSEKINFSVEAIETKWNFEEDILIRGFN